MEIQVENTCNVPLKDVVVTRELPSEMNIEVLEIRNRRWCLDLECWQTRTRYPAY